MPIQSSAVITMSKSDKHSQRCDGIEHPHDHDVLSGRGNFVNYHAGNEHFRRLVRKYKVDYIACPKPLKGKFSRMIVDEIRNLLPPGRFLKQDNVTKLWFDIGEKKALDKTRQALREGAPELRKGVDDYDDSGDDTDDDREIQGPILKSQSENLGGPILLTSMNHAGLNFDISNTRHASVGISNNNGNEMSFHSEGVPTLTPQLGASTFLAQHVYSNFNAVNHTNVVHSHPDYVIPLFQSDQFEPTPIHPNAQIRVAPPEDCISEEQAHSMSRRGLQRESSLVFENLFKEKSASSSSHEKISKKMEGSSQHLSAMSFSIGDMTDNSNLSAIFQDSFKISEGTPSMHPKVETIRKTQPPNYATCEMKKRAIGNLEMSGIQSFSSFGLENSMMHMSFKSGFDDESSKNPSI